MVTFTINIPPMLAYIPYMDPMGYIYIYTFKNASTGGNRPVMWIKHGKTINKPSPPSPYIAGIWWYKPFPNGWFIIVVPTLIEQLDQTNHTLRQVASEARLLKLLDNDRHAMKSPATLYWPQILPAFRSLRKGSWGDAIDPPPFRWAPVGGRS